MEQEYREYIHQMIDRISDERFLRQIYTLIYNYVKRAKI